MTSVTCRLAALIDDASAGRAGPFKDLFLKRLEGAQASTTTASQLVTGGSKKKKITGSLRAAIKRLKQARALLKSRLAKNAFDDATRAMLGTTIDAIRGDLVTLRANASQGIQISAVPASDRAQRRTLGG